MPLNVNSLVQQMFGLEQQQRGQTQEISRQQMEQGELGQQIAEALFGIAEHQRVVDDTRLAGELEAQQQSRRVAQAAGMDASAQNEVISGRMAQLSNDLLAYEQASLQAQQMDERGNLLANPLGWLNNVLNGPQVRATRDATAERAAQTASQLNNLHALTQSNVQTQNAIAETMTADSIRSEAEAAQLAAEATALQAEQQAKQYTIEGINTLREYGSVEFNRRASMYNTLQAARQHEEAMNMRRLELQQRQKALELEMEGQQSFEYIAELINSTQESLGSDAPPVNAGLVRQHWGQNTAVGRRLEAMADIAFLSEDRGSQVLGRNPYDAYNNLQLFNLPVPGNLDPAATEAFEVASAGLAEELAKAERFATDTQSTDLGVTKANMADPNTRANVFNQLYRQHVESQDRGFSSYEVQTQFIAQEDPTFTQTPFYQTVVQPFAESGTGVSLARTAELTAEKFAAGELTSDEAIAGLQRLYRDQKDLFSATSGRTAVGAPLPEDYPVRLLVGEKARLDYRTGVLGVTPGTFTRFGESTDLKSREIRQPVNLNDPADIAHWLTRYSSNRLAREMQRSRQEQSQ